MFPVAGIDLSYTKGLKLLGLGFRVANNLENWNANWVVIDRSLCSRLVSKYGIGFRV